MAAEADEPADMNFVRKHATEQAREFGLSIRDAATRVFSNSAGSYSANVGLAIENGGWEGEQQLQEQFVNRKGFAFNADKPGMMEQQVCFGFVLREGRYLLASFFTVTVEYSGGKRFVEILTKKIKTKRDKWTPGATRDFICARRASKMDPGCYEGFHLCSSCIF